MPEPPEPPPKYAPGHAAPYGGPVGRGYEQRFESKNAYEQRSESKIAYGPRAKLRTVREQNCVRFESKIVYGPRAKLRTVRQQKCVRAYEAPFYEAPFGTKFTFFCRCDTFLSMCTLSIVVTAFPISSIDLIFDLVKNCRSG